VANHPQYYGAVRRGKGFTSVLGCIDHPSSSFGLPPMGANCPPVLFHLEALWKSRE
jgi:hypothetical protein